MCYCPFTSTQMQLLNNVSNLENTVLVYSVTAIVHGHGDGASIC